MPKFIDPTGHANYGIGVCDRCKMKVPLDQLVKDPTYPGLRVCQGVENGCVDQLDPWRLPPKQTERIVLPFVRPDTEVSDDTGDIQVDNWGNISPVDD